MCEIIYLPPGVGSGRKTLATIEADLHRTAEVNNEGFGAALVIPVSTYKRQLITMTTMSELVAIKWFLRERRKYPFAPATFHARLATTGKVTADECHPVLAQKGHVAVFLNGTLDIPLSDGLSDTWQFAEDYADTFNPGDKAQRDAIQQMVRRTNARLLLMGDQWYDPVHIFNRDAWVMTPYGALASNLSHLGKGQGWDEAQQHHLIRFRYSEPGGPGIEVQWDETERKARTR